MSELALPSQEYLNSILEYDQNTGKLIWKYRPRANQTWNTRFSGKEAFTAIDPRKRGGYFVGGVDGKRYYKHRIIWKMVYGVDPLQIDHIDTNKLNNKLDNLRNISNTLNQRNMPTGKYNKYATGIGFDKERNKFIARIGSKYTKIYMIRFDKIEDAIEQRCKWEKELSYGPNHGGK